MIEEPSEEVNSRLEMADQEAANGADAPAQPGDDQPIEIPKKNQKPKEPPVTFREFDVRISSAAAIVVLLTPSEFHFSTLKILRIWSGQS